MHVHAFFADFMSHDRIIYINSRAGTRTTTVFYALHSALRLRQALLATIHSPEWQGSKFNSIVNRAAETVECAGMWKCIYLLLRAVFPALRLLRHADSNTPAMDKVEFLLHRTEQALIKSADDLNNDAIWGELSLNVQIEEEADAADADEFDDDDDAGDEDGDDASSAATTNSDEDESGDEDETSDDEDGLSGVLLRLWNHRKTKMTSDFSVTAWALSIMPEARDDVRRRLSGHHRTQIERTVIKLHKYDVDADPAKLVSAFWDEYESFDKRTGVFDSPCRWNAPEVTSGASHLWHQKYSLPHTEVLGFIACRVTSKTLGIVIGPGREDLGGRQTLPT